MALRDALLATLLDGEASGYELAKGFDSTVANFWTATPQQLYRELDKMTSDGVVSATVVEQTRRPNKKVYALTEAGRAELRESTTRTPRPIAIRDELLVQVQAMEAGDVEAVRRAVQAKRENAELKLGRYQRHRDRVLDGRSEAEFLATAERVGPYLTLARGIAFEEENVRWADLVLCVIDQRLGRA